MRPKHRHNHRRYSGRRRTERNRSKLTAVLILIFTLAVIVGSVFLGKYLKEKAEISALNREEVTDTSDTDKTQGENEPGIILGEAPPEYFEAVFVPRESTGETDSIGEGSAVTLVLRNGSGELLYSSPAAQSLGAQSSDTSLQPVADILSPFKEKGCYVSVYVSLSGISGENTATASAIRAFEGALIAEIAEGGADEIVLFGSDSLLEEDVASLCSFSENLRNNTSIGIPVGVLLPYPFFIREQGSELCREISRYFEFMAVDYTDAEVIEELGITDVIGSRIDSMQMYFSRYSVRIVIDTDIEEYDAVKQTVADKFVYSHQRVRRAEISAVSN